MLNVPYQSDIVHDGLVYEEKSIKIYILQCAVQLLVRDNVPIGSFIHSFIVAS